MKKNSVCFKCLFVETPPRFPSFSQFFTAATTSSILVPPQSNTSVKHLGLASLWPVGYVPPSVLARREEEERKRQKEEQERRRKEEIAAAKTCETSTNATAVDTTKKKKKRQKKTAGADEKEKGWTYNREQWGCVLYRRIRLLIEGHRRSSHPCSVLFYIGVYVLCGKIAIRLSLFDVSLLSLITRSAAFSQL